MIYMAVLWCFRSPRSNVIAGHAENKNKKRRAKTEPTVPNVVVFDARILTTTLLRLDATALHVQM